MTHKEAQTLYKERYGKAIKTCWIADMLRKHGRTKRESWNRRGTEPKYPCPDNVSLKLEKILKELSMIYSDAQKFLSRHPNQPKSL